MDPAADPARRRATAGLTPAARGRARVRQEAAAPAGHRWISVARQANPARGDRAGGGRLGERGEQGQLLVDGGGAGRAGGGQHADKDKGEYGQQATHRAPPAVDGGRGGTQARQIPEGGELRVISGIIGTALPLTTIATPERRWRESSGHRFVAVRRC